MIEIAQASPAMLRPAVARESTGRAYLNPMAGSISQHGESAPGVGGLAEEPAAGLAPGKIRSISIDLRSNDL